MSSNPTHEVVGTRGAGFELERTLCRLSAFKAGAILVSFLGHPLHVMTTIPLKFECLSCNTLCSVYPVVADISSPGLMHSSKASPVIVHSIALSAVVVAARIRKRRYGDNMLTSWCLQTDWSWAGALFIFWSWLSGQPGSVSAVCFIRLIFLWEFFILLRIRSTFILDILVKQIVGGWVVLWCVVSHDWSDMLRCWGAITVT